MNIPLLAYAIMLPVLFAVVVLAFIRLFRGPSLADRVVALDLLGTLGLCIAATYALATGFDAYLDVALIIGLIGFLGTVGFAHYLERRV